MLDENLVAFGDFDLSVFEGKSDPNLSFLLLLKEVSLLRPIVVVKHVVSNGVLQSSHLSDHL